MKKTLVIIFSIVLCIALAGVAVALVGEGGIIKKDEPISSGESELDNSAQKTDENTVSTIPPETETLSAEDKALKAEIAKISDTKVDFRVNKVQKFENESYSLTYKEIDPLFTEKGEEKLIYTGKTADGYDVSFKYNVNNGKIFVAKWDLPKTEKESASISMSEAENIARKYAAEYCDLNVYSLSYAKERTNEYVFVFTKFIDGYKTKDQLDVELNFNGDIIFLRNNTNIFGDANICIDEKVLISKLEIKLNTMFPNNKGYKIENKFINMDNGTPIMQYNVIVEQEEYVQSIVFTIPIE